MPITIHNLTNSPFDLLNGKGEKVRIAARGTIEGFKPHPSQLSIYRSLGYFRIEEGGASAPKGDERDKLRAQYEQLTGEKPDGRWSVERLKDEISAMETPQ